MHKYVIIDCNLFKKKMAIYKLCADLVLQFYVCIKLFQFIILSFYLLVCIVVGDGL